MHLHPILFGALAVFLFATTGNLESPLYDLPTTTPYIPLTTPADPTNCPLNGSAPFSWVVMIHDTKKKFQSQPDGPGGATQGVILTYKSVLTTASYYILRGHNDVSRYTIVGSRIWEWRDVTQARLNPCYQKRPVKEIHIHPKATLSPVRRILFDYAILIMESFFNVNPPAFPTVFFPNSPYELILNVQYVNVETKEECALPIPDEKSIQEGARERLVINSRIDFHTLKFHSVCIGLICTLDMGNRVSHDCRTLLQNRPNATMLCVRPVGYWTKQFKWHRAELDNPYAGTPYVCNASTLGLVTQEKMRSITNYRHPQYDFFLVVTFLRVWPWLMTELVALSPTGGPTLSTVPRSQSIKLEFSQKSEGKRLSGLDNAAHVTCPVDIVIFMTILMTASF